MTILLQTLTKYGNPGPRTMDAIARQARAEKDLETLQWLAPRVPLESSAAAIIAQTKAAVVRAAWVGRSDLPAQMRQQLLASETRVTVLRAAGVKTGSPALTVTECDVQQLQQRVVKAGADLRAAAVAGDLQAFVSAEEVADYELRAAEGQVDVAALLTPAFTEADIVTAVDLSAQALTYRRPAWLRPLLVHRSWEDLASLLAKVSETTSDALELTMRMISGCRSGEGFAENLTRALADCPSTTPQLRVFIVDEYVAYAPAAWRAEVLIERAPKSPAAFTGMEDAEEDLWQAGWAAVVTAHPSITSPTPTAAAYDWLVQAADMPRTMFRLPQVALAVSRFSPQAMVSGAYGYRHAQVASILPSLMAEQDTWPEGQVATWWAQLTTELATWSHDREVIAGLRSLASHPRFPWQVVANSADRWAEGLNVDDLGTWPAAAVRISTPSRSDVSERVAADVESLIDSKGDSAADLLVTLVEGFPGTWGDLLQAVRLAIR